MPIPVSIPRLGWNMEEGTFVEWLKADGDAVKPGDAVFRLEGEKATEDIESLDAGTLHIPANGPKTGDKLAVGAVIGYLLQPGEAAPAADAPAPLRSRLVDVPEPSSEPQVATATEQNGAPAITPRARRLAARLGVDAAHIRGSGRNGRVRERDIAALASVSPQTVPLTPTRRAIAARMTESRSTTAPVTLTSVVDATNLVNLREQFKAAASEPVPTYTDFLVKLAAVALQQHPLLAARWTDDGIVPAASIDIGLAVDTDAGLLVPVVRNVPTLGLRAVAARSRELIDRARKGELASRDMTSGCFTITNLGAFGIDAFTPIINPPECAILGVGRIERRPVMDGERVLGRELVTLSLTFDHRIVDGAPAARFLQTLAACITNPAPWVST
jgi:pyruvate dehydrogenase E2 component (dihydrolipoamide acetyltransferase)